MSSMVSFHSCYIKTKFIDCIIFSSALGKEMYFLFYNIILILVCSALNLEKIFLGKSACPIALLILFFLRSRSTFGLWSFKTQILNVLWEVDWTILNFLCFFFCKLTQHQSIHQHTSVLETLKQIIFCFWDPSFTTISFFKIRSGVEEAKKNYPILLKNLYV